MGVKVESQFGSPEPSFLDDLGGVFLRSKRVQTQPKQRVLGILVLGSAALYNEVFLDQFLNVFQTQLGLQILQNEYKNRCQYTFPY